MTEQVAVLGIGLGLTLALVCYLLTNISPGGMITPGWLAIVVVDEPVRLIVLIGVIAVTWAGLTTLRRFVIVYGKRLFAACVLMALFLQSVVALATSNRYPWLFEQETLGFIVPGLVAYQLLRQPLLATVGAVAVVTGITYAVVQSGVLLSLTT